MEVYRETADLTGRHQVSAATCLRAHDTVLFRLTWSRDALFALRCLGLTKRVVVPGQAVAGGVLRGVPPSLHLLHGVSVSLCHGGIVRCGVITGEREMRSIFSHSGCPVHKTDALASEQT
eukprot:3767832-Rhodomonas_salina.2